MLPLSAEQFQFAPVFKLGPKVFFGHLGEFLIAVLPPPPKRGITIPLARILSQEPFDLYSTISAALHGNWRRQDHLTRD